MSELDMVEAKRLIASLPATDVTYHFRKIDVEEGTEEEVLGHIETAIKMSDMFPAAIKRISELEAEVASWMDDRDRWIARYEAAQKENAALQERIGKLEEALKIEKGQNLLDEVLLP